MTARVNLAVLYGSTLSCDFLFDSPRLAAGAPSLVEPFRAAVDPVILKATLARRRAMKSFAAVQQKPTRQAFDV